MKNLITGLMVIGLFIGCDTTNPDAIGYRMHFEIESQSSSVTMSLEKNGETRVESQTFDSPHYEYLVATPGDEFVISVEGDADVSATVNGEPVSPENNGTKYTFVAPDK